MMNRITIEIEGGMVTNITSKETVDVRIIDEDNKKVGEDYIEEFILEGSDEEVS